MPTEKMISGDWWGEVKKQASPKYVTGDANPISVTVDFDKAVYEKLKKDNLLLQKLSDAGSKEYKAFIGRAAQKVKAAEAEVARAAANYKSDKNPETFNNSKTQIAQKLKAELQAEANSAPGRIEKAIHDAFSKYQKTKKEYKGYKIRAGVKLGMKFASLGFTVAKLVGTAGADLLAWRSLVRDTIKSVTEITKLCLSAETFRKATEKQLKVVRTWHAKLGNGAGATASERGLGLLKVLVGTDCEMTLDAVGSNVKQFKSKIQGVDLNSHAVAKKLTQALNAMDKAKREVSSGIKTEMAQLETQVRDLISEIGSLQSEVRKGEKWADDTKSLVDELKTAANVEKMGKIVKRLETAADIATSIKSWVDFAAKGDKLATRITKQTLTVAKNIERHMDDAKKVFA